jgi:hypothetical protein
VPDEINVKEFAITLMGGGRAWRLLIKRWRLHSFGFAFGLACALAGKDKCVQCALALKLQFFLRVGKK